MNRSAGGAQEDRRWPRRLYGEGCEPDPRFSLANERTFLAWIRTALALIALGAALHTIGPALDSGGLGRVYAVGAAALGLACAAESFRRWYVNERSLREQRPLGGARAYLVLTVILMVVGVTVVGAVALW